MNRRCHRKAAMLFKTEPFYSDISSYTHTNNWEILSSIDLLSDRGFSVDLIDRDNSDWRPSESYDIFLGLGVGNSGKHYVEYSKSSQAKLRVLLAMGPVPDVTNEKLYERYNNFKQRTGKSLDVMRLATEVSGQKFKDIMNNTDAIFSIGGRNTKSYDSFVNLGKPVYSFYPSTSPKVYYEENWLGTRRTTNFLCYMGNGMIGKGVDVILESFIKRPDLKLHICGPREQQFHSHYGKIISEAPNVKFHGFIEPGGPLFNQLASLCSFSILHSSTEGCCTSIATTMRAGLVPIINEWCGIKGADQIFSYMRDENIPFEIESSIDIASSLTNTEYEEKVRKTLVLSEDYTQASFVKSYGDSLDKLLGDFKL